MYPDSSDGLNYETEDAVYVFVTAYWPLDNWSAHAVKLWGKVFASSEHAYHYSKYAADAPEIAAEILAAPSPWKAMQLDRQHAEKRRPDWEAVKLDIMYEIVKAKVEQNEDVRTLLLKTGDKQIFENSPWDAFWGRGSDGTGQNHMGKILMRIRQAITAGNNPERES
jgi:ribA/ribD-fused uncharacterized protein